MFVAAGFKHDYSTPLYPQGTGPQPGFFRKQYRSGRNERLEV
jgi:hypothetical protein